MRIGLDFDNTIVSYDQLFHKVACEQGVVPPETPLSKLAVRDHLRRIDKEAVWTEMQGYVYGARMAEAQAYPGVIDFLRWASDVGHETAIVSHKTRHPFLGPQYDLHAVAREWILGNLAERDRLLIAASNVFFELTKEDKLARVATLGCDVFIDDLPEILQAPAFPANVQRILFDPDKHHEATPLPGVIRIQSWDELAQCLPS